MNSVPHPSADLPTIRDQITERKQAAVQAMAASTEALPQMTLVEEKPIHMTIAYLVAAGRTRSEIAQATRISIGMLANIAKQPWFKARLKEITDNAGKDMVKAFLEGEVLPSLEVLRSVRDNPDERGATRVAAANSILDRFMGKPTVHVEAKTNLNIHSAADAKDQVQSELEKVDAELRRLGVSTSTPRAN